MTDSYTITKIREALVASEGSRARAQRLLFDWVQSDDRLLRGLVHPFLKAIVIGAIEHATRPKEAAASIPSKAAPARTLSPEALDAVLSRMGQGAPPPSKPTPVSEPPPSESRPSRPPAGTLALGTTNPVPPKAAGPQHVATMKALAAAFARKRDR